jgi:hypothetical protein
MKMTPEAREAGYRMMEKTGSRPAAAEAMGISCRHFYDKMLDKNDDFREKMDAAKARYIARLEREALRRAVEGWDEPKQGYQGSIYHVRRYSDPLLLHLLKKKAPQEHGDAIKIDQTTRNDGDLTIDVTRLSKESRQDLRRILERELDSEDDQ